MLMIRDDQRFSKFVSEDTEKGWNVLFEEVKARETGDLSIREKLEFTEFLDLEGNESDQVRVKEIFNRVPIGQIWGEFYAAPRVDIEVVPGEELVVLKATQVGLMETPDIGSESERLWISNLKPSDLPAVIDGYFYLWMACPRCYYSAKVESGDDYIEWDEYRDEADPGCWACDGTGDWELGS